MVRVKFTDVFTAGVAAAVIFCVATLCAQQFISSSLYRQSKMVSMLVQQDSVGIRGMLEDTRGLKMAVKFAGALTAAYINFEMIPLNEAPTFATVFESLPDGVDIDNFEYHRKDLKIMGEADGEKDLKSFVDSLEEKDYFTSITCDSYDSNSGKVRFELVCVSRAVETMLILK